ncbi:AIG1 family-domain-containing protein [Gigaspora rosea]|uniref:AIG1 family-domain-containing protein n=1 Tax=Gigaspora rosea TaxID=44941 RepID=A0A397UZY9_9GLOM|nr:AIG1 family-domain-containing protein [Gigaspora rosea]
MTIDGRKFNIVDKPGIFDTSKPNEEVFKEIAKTVQKSAHGIKAILFVFEAKRFTEEQKNALNGIKTFLGENALNYMIAVFSHATKKQNEDKDEMRKAWNPTVASFIGSIGNRQEQERIRQEQERIQREKEEEERRIRAKYEERLRREEKERADRAHQEELNRKKAEFEQRQREALALMENQIANMRSQVEHAHVQ